MSRFWKAELAIGLCPDRLIVAGKDAPQWVHGAPIEALKEIAPGTKLRVVLSNHFVRYAVLPWSDALTSEEDWLLFAEHSFAAVYGDVAEGWKFRVTGGGGRKARVACAVDAALVDALHDMPAVVSIQPYLMAAFNARRRSLHEQSFWFVVQERGRLTMALVSRGSWKLIRNRQASEEWTEYLGDLLDREAAAAEEVDCDCVALYCENPTASKIGRYRVQDLTLARGAAADARPQAMAIH